MTKRKECTWVEPKRVGGPTLTATDVAEILKFRDVESVHILARKGPRQGGLPAYVPQNKGWALKEGAGLSGVQTFFYKDDIEKWDRENPAIYPERERVHYTPEEKAELMEVANQMRRPEDGAVVRTALMRRMVELYGHKKWGRRAYPKIRQILNDENVPIPPETPYKPDRPRRKYKKCG